VSSAAARMRPEGSTTYPMGFEHLTRPDGLTWLPAVFCNRRVWLPTRAARPERCGNV
jgi:hypothetical protein